jgi:hypothetical protein
MDAVRLDDPVSVDDDVAKARNEVSGEVGR